MYYWDDTFAPALIIKQEQTGEKGLKWMADHCLSEEK